MAWYLFGAEPLSQPMMTSHQSHPPFTAASAVLQSEPRTFDWTPRPISGGHKPSPNGSNWHPPPKSAYHLHSQTRSRDEAVRSDHSEQLTVFPWYGDSHRTSTLHLMWSASLGCVAKFCLCILETTPASRLLLADNCQLPTIVALANFVAWSPLKVHRNINSLYRNPTLQKSIKVVMARQTSLEVTTPELTFFLLLSLSGPKTTPSVFGHSIWLSNGSMKSTVFRSAIEHTTRNNKYRSNSRKCHLVVVIPYRWPLVYMNYLLHSL